MNILEYKIHSELGKGGMATVYLAEDEKFKHSVAIKVLNKEFVHNDNIRKRFLSEARNIFKMSHPNIIKVTDLIDEGDTVAFVMEYIEGQTLKEYLDTKGKLNEEEIKRLFAQMLEAVGYVHEQGLIHRDIKPSNFMISSKGVVKLLDFGIAKNTDTTSAEYTQTGTTQNMGTPMYMSPEQVKSTKEVTAQSDIYSLGVVLWQMVKGKKPYDTNTTSTFELQTKIVNEKLELTNTSFDAIITDATAKDLKGRYINCLQFKNQLLHKTEDLESTKLFNNNVFEQTVVQEKELLDNRNVSNFESIKKSDDIENKKISTNPFQKKVFFIILGIGIIILIAYRISLNDISTQSEIESIVTEDTTTAVSTWGTTQAKNIVFTNNSNSTGYLAVGFMDSGGYWRSIGWYAIKSGENYTYTLPIDFTDDKIYWYVEASDKSGVWTGNDAEFCINPTDRFDINNSEKCASSKGFTKLTLKGDYTYQGFKD
jgi:serine/threonine protein kinase